MSAEIAERPDPTLPIVELIDTDMGVVARGTWPDVRVGLGPDADWAAVLHSESLACHTFVDWIRNQAPHAEVHFTRVHIAIRQPGTGLPDLVLYPGETLRAIAGQVTR